MSSEMDDKNCLLIDDLIKPEKQKIVVAISLKRIQIVQIVEQGKTARLGVEEITSGNIKKTRIKFHDFYANSKSG